jgi:hypothetical protein
MTQPKVAHPAQLAVQARQTKVLQVQQRQVQAIQQVQVVAQQK